MTRPRHASRLIRTTREWERRAVRDPYHAVLTWRGLGGRRWLEQEERFWATGKADVERVLAQVEELTGRHPGGSALDFGCGIGRLSQALADHFDSVVGIDASPTMVRLATGADRSAGRCRFVVNDRLDLDVLGNERFNLVISLLVLQHLAPPLANTFIAELARRVEVGGVLAIQVPTTRSPRRKTALARARRWKNRLLHRIPRTELHVHELGAVETRIRDAGLRTAGALEDGRVGEWGTSHLVVALRPAD